MISAVADESLKDNVRRFNDDVRENSGYRYTTGSRFSARVANQRLTEAVANLIDRDAESILDVGCGDGVYTAELQRLFPAIKFTGLDAAEAAVSMARIQYPAVNFITGNALDPLSLPRADFTMAILRGVLHHTSDPESAIRNVARIARSLIIVEPNGRNPVLKIIEKTSRYHIEHEEQVVSASRPRALV